MNETDMLLLHCKCPILMTLLVTLEHTKCNGFCINSAVLFSLVLHYVSVGRKTVSAIHTSTEK